MDPKNTLSFQLDARFCRYAVLTGAVILAAKPAQAGVISTVVAATDFTTGFHSLDVNGDAFTDYVFSGFGTSFPFVYGLGTDVFYTSTFSTGVCSSSFSFSISNVAHDLIAIGANTGNAVALSAGALIGPLVGWATGAGMPEFSATGPLFMGLQFYDTNGNRYYGFAEFDPWAFEGFAFDNVPNTPITTFDLLAPEPGSLGMLALGAAGLELLRRKRANRA